MKKTITIICATLTALATIVGIIYFICHLNSRKKDKTYLTTEI